MLNYFVPDYYIESYKLLNIEKLKENGIKLLICDIDNTLVPHDQQHMDEDAKAFLEKVIASGLEVVLVSNNTKERVDLFAKDHHISTYPFAKKPLKKTYRVMLQEYPYQPNQVAALGDQLLTDIFGGNRMGFYTILTNPLVKKDLSFTKINRFFEMIIFNLLKWTHKLEKGNYHD